MDDEDQRERYLNRKQTLIEHIQSIPLSKKDKYYGDKQIAETFDRVLVKNRETRKKTVELQKAENYQLMEPSKPLEGEDRTSWYQSITDLNKEVDEWADKDEERDREYLATMVQARGIDHYFKLLKEIT